MIDFSNLRNPFLFREGWAIKDACMARHQGAYYIFCSAFFEEAGEERCHIAGFTSANMLNWRALFVRGGDELGALGLASPDLSYVDGKYILAYNTWGDKPGAPNRLLYAQTSDFSAWEWDLPLASSATNGVRAIDAALTTHEGYCLLCWKERQALAFALADSPDAHNWTRVEARLDGWYENCQFIAYEGELAMIATGKGHLPYLLKRDDPSRIGCWSGAPIQPPPMQRFNTCERANAASLFCEDGMNYLVYAGATRKDVHATRGDCALGIARSSALGDWIPAEEAAD